MVKRIRAGAGRVVGENSAGERGRTSVRDRERLARLQISDRSPATGPRMPASRQLATSAGSGASSNRHRMHAVWPRNHRHDLAAHPEHAAVCERRRGRDRNIVDEELRGRAIGPIDHEIEALEESRGRCRRRARSGTVSICQSGIDIAQMTRGCLDLEVADVGTVIDDLAMEIGHLDRIGIDQAETRDLMRARERAIAAGTPSPPTPTISMLLLSRIARCQALRRATRGQSKNPRSCDKDEG